MFQEQFRQLVRESHFPVLSWGDENFTLTKPMVQSLREMSYQDQWRTSVENKWFHIQLENLSLLVFSTYGGYPSYSYIDRPIDVPSFREYISSKDDAYNYRTREIYAEDYQQVIATAGFRNCVSPIRYDYDPTGYRQGIHPIAHIHIGLDNQIRLATRREMTPTSFLLFVMRQLYPHCWSRLIEKRHLHKLARKVREDLIQVHDQYFTEIDFDSIFLN